MSHISSPELSVVVGKARIIAATMCKPRSVNRDLFGRGASALL